MSPEKANFKKLCENIIEFDEWIQEKTETQPNSQIITTCKYLTNLDAEKEFVQPATHFAHLFEENVRYLTDSKEPFLNEAYESIEKCNFKDLNDILNKLKKSFQDNSLKNKPNDIKNKLNQTLDETRKHLENKEIQNVKDFVNNLKKLEEAQKYLKEYIKSEEIANSSTIAIHEKYFFFVNFFK